MARTANVGAIEVKQTERAVYLATVNEMEPAPLDPVPRAYLGSEFCAELLPSAAELGHVLNVTRRADQSLTLCTPPVTDPYLPRLLALADFLAEQAPETEIVVNDWGLLRALQSYPMPLTAGRTFQKNKRDPRILTLWPNLSPAMRAFYQGNNVLQPSFQELLRRFRVSRMEIDLPPWGVDTELLRHSKLPISLHVPYTYISTSHVCPTLAAMDKVAAGSGQADGCTHPCLDTTFTLRNPVFAAPLRLRGNTYFVESEAALDESLLAGTMVDRVVWSGPVAEEQP